MRGAEPQLSPKEARKGCRWSASPGVVWIGTRPPTPAAQMGCLRNRSGAHQGRPEGERDIWWTVGATPRAAGHLGLMHTETHRGRLWAACRQRCVDSKSSQTTPATTSTTSIRQLLGAADAQTAHHATSCTALHTNHWAPRTQKRHRQEHRPQQPLESSNPTQHVKGRTGDCPGPRKETTTRRNVTQGGGGGFRDTELVVDAGAGEPANRPRNGA